MVATGPLPGKILPILVIDTIVIGLMHECMNICHLNTAGVPRPNPLMSNIIMCIRNSPTLEQEAQNGPHVFSP